MESHYSPEDIAGFTKLWRSSLIPLHACLVGLTWIVHDYFLTLEDEMRYIWPQKPSFGKYMFLWIRYYSIALLIFDVTQIHVFSIPGVTSDTVCVAMDTVIRVVGAIALWSIEIVMQLRIYALYDCSKAIAAVNGAMFLVSVGTFLWILIHNALRRSAVIAHAIHLPLPGCPSIHSGIEWAQWVPATAFEAVLFFLALQKTLQSTAQRFKRGERISLYELVLRDQIIYFFLVTILLVFNNLMVVGVTKIPWFSYSPFHAALGVLTTRMMLNTRKASREDVFSSDGTKQLTTSGEMISPSTEENPLPWTAAEYGSPLSSFDQPRAGCGSLEAMGHPGPKAVFDAPFAQYAGDGKESVEMQKMSSETGHEWARRNESGTYAVLDVVVPNRGRPPRGSLSRALSLHVESSPPRRRLL
ncbi:hypothetical protein HDZ31DRAFT_60113 [Schizophyllum fasciatum]